MSGLFHLPVSKFPSSIAPTYTEPYALISISNHIRSFDAELSAPSYTATYTPTSPRTMASITSAEQAQASNFKASSVANSVIGFIMVAPSYTVSPSTATHDAARGDINPGYNQFSTTTYYPSTSSTFFNPSTLVTHLAFGVPPLSSVSDQDSAESLMAQTVSTTTSITEPQATQTVSATISITKPQVTQTLSTTISITEPQATQTLSETISIMKPQVTQTVGTIIPITEPQATQTLSATVLITKPQVAQTVSTTIQITEPQATQTLSPKVLITKAQATQTVSTTVQMTILSVAPAAASTTPAASTTRVSSSGARLSWSTRILLLLLVIALY
ncbi:Mucin-21 [Toensbergia leucococca]|nr:Mucin-21 [Toensbergia leucococca]